MLLDTVKELCRLSGVSSYEDRVREYIKSRIEGYADSVETDAMGNLIAFKKGRVNTGKTVLVAAHMDEVGLMITHITKDGYLKFAPVGGIDRRVLLGKKVYVGEKGVFGVIGNKAIHLVKQEERSKTVKTDDMYIDIGAENEEEAKKLVSPGDVAAFDSNIIELGGRRIKAKALDDRVGCAVMIELMEKELPIDCYFAFTVQEEVGTRGAFGAAFRIKPDIAMVLETTTAADIPSVKGVKKICTPGKGVVIPFMDGGTIYDRGLYSIMTSAADENGIPWQTKTMIAGGTDARTIQTTGCGARVIGLAAAVGNIHTPASTADVGDIEAMAKLAGIFLEKIGATD